MAVGCSRCAQAGYCRCGLNCEQLASHCVSRAPQSWFGKFGKEMVGLGRSADAVAITASSLRQSNIVEWDCGTIHRTA